MNACNVVDINLSSSFSRKNRFRVTYWYKLAQTIYSNFSLALLPSLLTYYPPHSELAGPAQ